MRTVCFSLRPFCNRHFANYTAILVPRSQAQGFFIDYCVAVGEGCGGCVLRTCRQGLKKSLWHREMPGSGFSGGGGIWVMDLTPSDFSAHILSCLSIPLFFFCSSGLMMLSNQRCGASSCSKALSLRCPGQPCELGKSVEEPLLGI